MHLVRDEAILVMKVGLHGNETLADIISRKQNEELVAGFCFWGYGGNLCHPFSVVQPFAQNLLTPARRIRAVFVKTTSPFFGDHIEPADEYSINGMDWLSLPKGISVTASKFALVLKNLRQTSESICYGSYSVAVGPSAGKSLRDYMRFRVDKAVAVRNNSPDDGPVVAVDFTADLIEPYAISVRRRGNL